MTAVPDNSGAPDCQANVIAGDGLITAIVFSRNEGDLLSACLERLGDFHEIVVCDMQSTDRTAAVATSFGARIVDVPFTPIVERARQRGLAAAQTQWAMLVDADEILPAGYHASLVRALAVLDADVVAVRLPCVNLAFGRPLRHVLANTAKYSLVQPARVDFSRARVAHAAIEFHGPVADAPSFVPAFDHHGYRDVAQITEKFLRYARSNPQSPPGAGAPLYLARELVRDVVLRGAWRDGRPGVTVATLNAFARYYAAALDWEGRGVAEDDWNPSTRAALSVAQRGGGLGQRAARFAKRASRKDRSNNASA